MTSFEMGEGSARFDKKLQGEVKRVNTLTRRGKVLKTQKLV